MTSSRLLPAIFGLSVAITPALALASDVEGAPSSTGSFALSSLVFLPLVASIAALLFGRFANASSHALRRLLIVASGAELALALGLYASFDASRAAIEAEGAHSFIERLTLSRALKLEYFVGADGLSLTLILLTALLGLIAALASPSVQKRAGLYGLGQGLLVTGMMGALVALDLRLFYGFWLITWLGACTLVGFFGGKNRKRATIKLAASGLVGSAALLFAVVALSLHSGAQSFALPELIRIDYLGSGASLFGMTLVKPVFVALFIAFAGLLALAPLHGGIVDALVEAPTSVSVLLAGAWLKLGGYGLLRLNLGLLPEASAWAAEAMAALGVVTLLYASVRALSQTDFKRFIAYASFAPLGYALLGMASLTPAGIQASVMQMVSHGLVVALLFLVAGSLEARARTREMASFGGLASELPALTTFAAVAFLASVGAPGLSGFVGEAMALLGAFPVYEKLSLAAALGIGLAALCHGRAFQRLFLGEFRRDWRKSELLEPFGGKFPPLRPHELSTLLPLAVLVIALGFYPRPLLALTDAHVIDLANALRAPLGPMQISLTEISQQVLAFVH